MLPTQHHIELSSDLRRGENRCLSPHDMGFSYLKARMLTVPTTLIRLSVDARCGQSSREGGQRGVLLDARRIWDTYSNSGAIYLFERQITGVQAA